MRWFRKHRQPEPPKDERLTEDEANQIRQRLRFQLEKYVENLWFIDEAFKKHPELDALIIPDDKRSMAIAGFDPIIEDFVEFMRTRVKPNPKQSDGHGN